MLPGKTEAVDKFVFEDDSVHDAVFLEALDLLDVLGAAATLEPLLLLDGYALAISHTELCGHIEALTGVGIAFHTTDGSTFLASDLDSLVSDQSLASCTLVIQCVLDVLENPHVLLTALHALGSRTATEAVSHCFVLATATAFATVPNLELSLLAAFRVALAVQLLATRTNCSPLVDSDVFDTLFVSEFPTNFLCNNSSVYTFLHNAASFVFARAKYIPASLCSSTHAFVMQFFYKNNSHSFLASF